MLFPSKHINFSKSLLGFACHILQKLDEPKDVDTLWNLYQKDLQKKSYFVKHDFDNLILALIFLYSVKAIEQKNGMIYKCT